MLQIPRRLIIGNPLVVLSTNISIIIPLKCCAILCETYIFLGIFDDDENGTFKLVHFAVERVKREAVL